MLRHDQNIFEEDEWPKIKVLSEWTEADLLGQVGMANLADILPIIKTDRATILKHFYQLEKQGHEPYQEMGLKKFSDSDSDSDWLVRMKVFSPYYLAILKNHYDMIPKHFSKSEILTLEGQYNVRDVCERLGLSYEWVMNGSKQELTRRGIYLKPDSPYPQVIMVAFVLWLKDQGYQPKSLKDEN